MGAPGSGMKAADQPAAETLLTAFKTIDAAERRKHASVLNYWLSIRGDKEFPPLHDLDPLELSDAGPNSALLELISGGHDAEIRHLGEALRGDDWPEQIMEAPNPSILACIAKKLPIVAISRDFLAFEDEFATDEGKTRCWVTLLPLSAGGAWVDYVYALVSFDSEGGKATKPAKPAKAAAKEEAPEEAAPEVADEPVAEEAPEPVAEEAPEPVAEAVEEPEAEAVEEPEAEAVEEPAAAEEEAEVAEEPAVVEDEAEEPVEAVTEEVEEAEAAEQEEAVAEAPTEESEEPVAAAVAKAAPGFSKLLDSLAGLTGFYGSQPVKVEPVVDPEEPAAEEPEAAVEEPEPEEAEEPAAVVEELVEAEDHAEDEPVAMQETADEPPVEEPAEIAEPQPETPAAKEAAKPTRASEGTLQNKLADVRAKADEARMAKLRANLALYEGLSAAYDFALDAEEAPEEYLRLVEAQGLKIQLRSPMKPVVKLAFDGMCDDATIKQLEAILAWAFDEELPRGALAERIEAAGGISRVLNGEKKAA